MLFPYEFELKQHGEISGIEIRRLDIFKENLYNAEFHAKSSDTPGRRYISPTFRELFKKVMALNRRY